MAKKQSSELSEMFRFAGNRHWLTIVGCILAVISTLLSMCPFVCIWFVIKDIIHAMMQGNISLATECTAYAVYAVIFAVLSILFYSFALCCSHLAAFRTASNMKKEAMHHIVELPLGYFSQNETGKLRKIIDDNAGLTEGFLAHQLPDLVSALVMPVAIIVLLFIFDWRLGILCLIPVGVSIIFLHKMMGGDNADFMSGYMNALEDMNKEAVEFVRGIPVVKVFQQTVYSFKNFRDAIKEYKKYASGYAINCRIPMTGFNVTLNSTFVLLIPVAVFLFQAANDPNSQIDILMAFIFYSLFTPVCTTCMNRIMFASEQLMTAKSAVSRINAILNEKPLAEPISPKKPKDTSITFENVTFSYPGSNKLALKNTSFDVAPGQTVAFVGASGSGKSSAARLIPRFYDATNGKVSVGGVDVKDIAKNDLMNEISFVFQNTRLFKDTLLENIRAARPNATREEVMEAVKAAQCEEIINRLPDGLDTKIGAEGTYLSGGESQRIALARAILKNSPIIILDEATAFADAENEHKIQLAFEQLARGKTVLMIAHRLTTIQNADKIFVFDNGEIVERGTHTELLETNGKYASMWRDYQTSIEWKVGKESNND